MPFRHRSGTVVALALGAGLSLTLASRAAESPAISYGDLYLAQERETKVGHTDLSLAWANGLGNPNFVVQGAQLSLMRWLNERVTLGAQLTLTQATPTSLQTTLEKQLGTAGFGLDVSSPEGVATVRLGASPVGGLFNFSGDTIRSFDLIVGAGLGTGWHRPGLSGPAFDLFVQQRIEILRATGLSLEYSQLWENLTPGVWTPRGQLQVGMYVRL